MDNLKVKRGEIWKVELGHDKIGSEQGGLRYGIILQNDIGNKYSTTTIIALCTTRDKHKLPTHFDIDILKPSTVMLEQILTVDKNRLIK
ncbi:MAG: type II toxin-antitoxin system PemK/MazF family toxin, partial [Bacilli bacterium]